VGHTHNDCSEALEIGDQCLHGALQQQAWALWGYSTADYTSHSSNTVQHAHALVWVRWVAGDRIAANHQQLGATPGTRCALL